MTSHINQLISIADKRGSGHMFSQWETNSHTDTHSPRDDNGARHLKPVVEHATNDINKPH